LGITGPTGDQGSGLQVTLTNGNAGAITRGQVVYLSGTNTADLALAATDTALADYVAFVQDASISAAASGSFVPGGSGTAVVRLHPGLTPTAGQRVYLSSTIAGSCHTTIPGTSGNVRQPVGNIKDPLTYDGGADLLVEVVLKNGNKAIVP
jgi:hypothetical protein